MGTLLLLAQLSVVTPVEHHEGWLHAAIAGAMIAHGADLATTSYAMGKLGDRFREANPVLRPFAHDPVVLDVAKTGLAVGLNYTLLRLHKQHPKITLAIAVGQIVGIGYVAHRNAKTLGLR